MPRVPQRPRRRLQHHLDAAVPADASISTSPADLPEVFIEWAPNDGPAVVDPTWVSLSPYATQGSTARGRVVEFDQFQAGTMSITLETFTRLFDPENTAGIYYGKLTPMRQIRVRAKWAGTFYPIFRGYVKSWGSTIVRNKKFVTTVTCADGFLRLEQSTLPSSPYARVVLAERPTAWFRLNESDTTKAADSSGNGVFGTYVGCSQGQSGLVSGDSDRSASFGTSGEYVLLPNGGIISGYPFSIEMMFKIDDSGSYLSPRHLLSATLAVAAGSGVEGECDIWMNSAFGGQLVFYVRSTTAVTSYLLSAYPYDDGLPHHLVCVADSASTFHMYVDGADVGTIGAAASPVWPGPFPSGYTLGGRLISLATGGFGTSSTDGVLDEIAIYDGRNLTPAQVAAHSAAAFGWIGDATGARATRLLDLIGWPTSLRAIDTGVSTLGSTSWANGASALSILQSWADTELGAFFMGRDGTLIWRSRHYPILNTNATRSRATFGDVASTAPIKIRDDDLDIYRDSTLIRNPVYASRTGGVTAKAVDDSLVASTYGDRSWSAPTSDDRYDISIPDRAAWLLGRFKNEYARLRAMTANVRQQPTNWSTVLDLELGDRITIKRTPLGLDSQINVDQIIEGIAWDFTPFDLTPTFRGSPVDPGVGSYLILDDAVSGLLDTAKLGY